MAKRPARGARLAGLHLRRSPAAWAALVVMAGAGLAWGGHAAWDALQTWGTPTCSGPLQVRGAASPAQAGLVRCYVRALASRDTAGLMAVADDNSPVRITSADLKYSADARAGLATATFTPNPVDPDFPSVTITYADGAREYVGMTNMSALGESWDWPMNRWRVDIGTVINPGPSEPFTQVSPSS